MRKVIIAVVSSILALIINIGICFWLCLTGWKREVK